MANYRGHLKGGFAAFALVIVLAVPHYRPSALTILEWLLCAMAGALFPDIDIKSKGQKYFYWVIVSLLLLLIFNHQYRTVAVISTLSFTPLLVKHRGIFHSLWFVIALPLAIWYGITYHVPDLQGALFINIIFFIAGAVSHLILDKHRLVFFHF